LVDGCIPNSRLQVSLWYFRQEDITTINGLQARGEIKDMSGISDLVKRVNVESNYVYCNDVTPYY
jgi:hypothetical protein